MNYGGSRSGPPGTYSTGIGARSYTNPAEQPAAGAAPPRQLPNRYSFRSDSRESKVAPPYYHGQSAAPLRPALSRDSSLQGPGVAGSQLPRPQRRSVPLQPTRPAAFQQARQSMPDGTVDNESARSVHPAASWISQASAGAVGWGSDDDDYEEEEDLEMIDDEVFAKMERLRQSQAAIIKHHLEMEVDDDNGQGESNPAQDFGGLNFDKTFQKSFKAATKKYRQIRAEVTSAVHLMQSINQQVHAPKKRENRGEKSASNGGGGGGGGGGSSSNDRDRDSDRYGHSRR